MPKRPIAPLPTGLALSDPRRPLKFRRLAEERLRIAAFLDREPREPDPEFREWEGTVRALLLEIFGSGEFINRFGQLRFRSISYAMGGGFRWFGSPEVTWRSDLQSADKVLRDALEESGIEASAAPVESSVVPRSPSLVVNIHNENVFSADFHVTVAQMLERLETLPISETERELAKDHIRDLTSETEGEKRWPIIGKSLDAMKSLSKSVYKDIAVPLLVEFLKREAGLSAKG